MNNAKVDVSYDNVFDVLYLKFKSTSNSYGDETIDYLVIFKDIDTDEITGLTIFDFKKLYDRKDKIISIIAKYIDTDEVYTNLCNKNIPLS